MEKNTFKSQEEKNQVFHPNLQSQVYTDLEFSPARNITNRTGFKKTVGKFPSLKMRRTVMWESQIERDFLYLLEFDADVLSFYEQPVEILYAHKTKTGRYFPDLYVERRSCKELIEIKPSSKLNDPKNKIKFLAGEEYCRRRGWIFRVVTDDNIREGNLLKNVKLLNRYAAVDVSTEFEQHTQSLVETNDGEIGLAELIVRSREKFGKAAISNIYSLLYHQLLYADLKKTLSDQTTIKLSKGVE
ncbi:MAG TPA: TnsA endonuclease N-terminal domain-containing protein [Candidatus Methanoperedens sp.]